MRTLRPGRLRRDARAILPLSFPRRIGKVPAAQETFGRVQASNGRTSLERLTKRSSAQTDQLTAAGAYNPALGSRLPAAGERDGIG